MPTLIRQLKQLFLIPEVYFPDGKNELHHLPVKVHFTAQTKQVPGVCSQMTPCSWEYLPPLLPHFTSFCPVPSLRLTVTLWLHKVKTCFSSISSLQPPPSYPAQSKNFFLLRSWPCTLSQWRYIPLPLLRVSSSFWKIPWPSTALTMPPACPTRSASGPQGTAPWCQGHYREHAWSPQNHTSYLQSQLGSATNGLSSITPLSVL